LGNQGSPARHTSTRQKPVYAFLRAHEGAITIVAWAIVAAAIIALHLVHDGLADDHDLRPAVHSLREVAITVPVAVFVLALTRVLARETVRSDANGHMDIAWPGLRWAAAFASLSGFVGIGAGIARSTTAGAGNIPAFAESVLNGSLAFAAALVALVAMCLVTGLPWRGSARAPARP
jgi:hypothetical protein